MTFAMAAWTEATVAACRIRLKSEAECAAAPGCEPCSVEGEGEV